MPRPTPPRHAVTIACLASLLIAAASCWDYKTDSSTGINAWGTFFPHCVSLQQSPIPFSSAETLSAAANAQLVRIQNSSQTVTALITSSSSSLITAKFNRPVYVRFRGLNYFVQSIVVHSAAEHSSVEAKISGEVQILLAPNSIADTSLVLAVQIAPTKDLLTPIDPSSSIISSILSVVANQSSLIGAKGEVSSTVSYGSPLLNLPSSSYAMTYNGSVSFPPCLRLVTVVVFSSALPFPQSMTSSIRGASNGVVTIRPRQPRLAGTVATRLLVSELPTANGQLIPLSTPHPVQFVTETAFVPNSNPLNLSMEIAIICLTVFCVALLAVIGLLVLARYEYIDLPTWLGGISRRVEWWENPKSARTVVNSDEDEEDEEEEEEDEEDEEEDEEDDEDVEMAPRH